jgi:hypothetical protein
VTCTELVKHRPSFGDKVVPERFEQLTARELVTGWRRKAENWIAFNSWGACVTGLEKGRDILDALSLNESLCRRFADLVERESMTTKESRAFKALWPIFHATELHRLRVTVTATRRDDRVRQLLEAGAKSTAPTVRRLRLSS